MTATGWYNVVTPGARTGAFNLEFHGQVGNPLGDPYGSMALLSVVVPNRISNGQSLPTIKVLVQGLKLEQFDSSGASLGECIHEQSGVGAAGCAAAKRLADDRCRSASFAAAAAYCEEPISTTDLNGNAVADAAIPMQPGRDRQRPARRKSCEGSATASSLMLTLRRWRDC